jgi:biotin operon repressor
MYLKNEEMRYEKISLRQLCEELGASDTDIEAMMREMREIEEDE